MREIKFRFWDGEKMYDWSWAQEYQVEHVFNPDMEIWKVMQFTGLLDRYGVEIYEGDIIESTWNGNKFEVTWGDGEWTWFPDCDSNRGKENYRYAGTKIIGNIYQNPELIK